MNLMNMSKINEVLTATILYSIISYILQLPKLYVGILIAIATTQINRVLPQNYKHTLVLYIPLVAFTIEYPSITVPLMIGYTSDIHVSIVKEGMQTLISIQDYCIYWTEELYGEQFKKG